MKGCLATLKRKWRANSKAQSFFRFYLALVERRTGRRPLAPPRVRSISLGFEAMSPAKSKLATPAKMPETAEATSQSARRASDPILMHHGRERLDGPAAGSGGREGRAARA